MAGSITSLRSKQLTLSPSRVSSVFSITRTVFYIQDEPLEPATTISVSILILRNVLKCMRNVFFSVSKGSFSFCFRTEKAVEVKFSARKIIKNKQIECLRWQRGKIFKITCFTCTLSKCSCPTFFIRMVKYFKLYQELL